MKKLGSGWENESVVPAEETWEILCPGIERFRLPGNEAVRRVITGRKYSRTGCLYSFKNGKHVVHESRGEEKFARHLEVHPSVTAFFGQPETLKIAMDEGHGEIRYTPDFLVVMGHVELRVEYKRAIDLRPRPPKSANDERGIRRASKAAKMRRRLRIVRDAYARCGVAWQLITDRDLQRMSSESTVDELIANLGRPIGEADLRRLVTLLRARPDRSAPMFACEAALKDSSFPRGDILARIPERLVTVDLFDPISSDTSVKLLEHVQ